MKPIHYIELNTRDTDWGLAVQCVGYESTQPGQEYPPKHHPASHYYSPRKGRVLNDYGIIYVTEGEGFFQSRHCPLTRVSAGSIFLLFPGEWHNYYPAPETGWTHMWICFRGDNMDRRVERGFLSAQNPVYSIGVSDDIVRLYTQAVSVAEQRPDNFQILLAGIVNHLLGIVCTYDHAPASKDRAMAEKMNRARMLMLHQVESHTSIQELARQLNMSYSTFRQRFKEHTGSSPAAYLQELKIQRAIELLRNTPMSVKEIACLLGFNSWDNFCTMFKRKTGKRPGDYR